MKYVFDAERISNWVCEKAGGAYQPNYTAIGIEKNGVLQAAFIYHTFTGENGSIVMGGRCDNKFSTTRLFYAMAFNYPFEQLGVKRINSLIKKSNKDAFAINKNLGFIQEHIVKDYFPNEDGIFFQMYQKDCRFLKGKYALALQNINR